MDRGAAILRTGVGNAGLIRGLDPFNLGAMMRPWRTNARTCAAACALGFAGLLRCASPGTQPAPASSPACSATLPSDQACATSTPSYAADVAPIVQADCLPCHFTGNTYSSQVFETPKQLHDNRQLAETQLYRCQMPPADGGTIDTMDRETLLAWLACGAPDN